MIFIGNIDWMSTLVAVLWGIFLICGMGLLLLWLVLHYVHREDRKQTNNDRRF